ncbi:MAG TPA: MmgE/PrpD family protein, partial [Burkholderiales bacterium]|nr:MmgE/PrpD family protein [Burkholderiales bacterium]
MTEGSSAVRPTLDVARWIATLRHEDIPERSRTVARCAILDTLGCGVYGYRTPWAGMLLQWARAGGSKAEATVWGDSAPTLRAADA